MYIRLIFPLLVLTSLARAETIAFFVSGDPQYLAEKSDTPQKLDPYSEEANSRFIQIVNRLPGETIPENLGGGMVTKTPRGMIVAGDLIDSLDKRGGSYPAMQRFEWARYKSDYGLKGSDGKLPFPVYELHGNHDGPQGDTFVCDELIERNRERPGVINTSTNGLHYSWNWGPVHLVNVGMFVGWGEARRSKAHYAPRGSLAFLERDLKEQVGDSGRPVIISHHLHLNSAKFDWPEEDLKGYYDLISQYNVIAIFNGHTHGEPRRFGWNGTELGPQVEGISNFDPDDSGAAKTGKGGKPVGMRHGLMYVELEDQPGTEQDRLIVRSYETKDNWATSDWGKVWERPVSVPDAAPAYTELKDLSYRPDATNDYAQSRCKLDLYLPSQVKDFATVVWFHGGGITGGNKSIPKQLKEQGIAVVAVNYRLYPKVACPVYLEDAAASVAWVFKNIETYGGSAKRIFVSGHSAGGYLTSMVGLDKQYLAKHAIDANDIAGLIPFSGHTITHFTVRKEQGIDKTQPTIDAFAPLFHVRKDAPPLVLITGDREIEMLGRYEENAYLYRMMKVVGHEQVSLHELKGMNHGQMPEGAFPILLEQVREIVSE
jgi:acetyl esterase/lipase